MNQPKPCPFCGGKEITVHPGSTFRWVYAACDSCGAQAGEVRVQTMGYGTKEEWMRTGTENAIQQWNERKP